MAYNAARKPALHVKANPNAAPREPVAARDWSAKAGAYEQAELIRRYWHAKGHLVDVRVVPVGGDGLFGVRSSLVDGMPLK